MKTPRHRPLAALLLACLWVLVPILPIPADAQSIDAELPLPRWEESPPSLDSLSPGGPFNNLLPGTLIPALTDGSEVQRLGPRLDDAPTGLSSQIGPTDLSLFLHGSLLQNARPAQAPRVPTPALAIQELPPDQVAALADIPANEYLADPQNLVPEVVRGDLDRLLEFHASDARIRLHVLVLDADQKLPASADPLQFAHGTLTRHLSCLAVYPLGEPWRTRIFLSKTLHHAAAADELTDMASDCIRDAQEADDPSEQLQRYTIRLCTRLYWLQKKLPDPAMRSVVNTTPSLQEVTGSQESAVSFVSRYLLPSSLPMAAIGGIVILWQLLKRLKKRRQDHPSHVWILPEPEVIPRLGGAFSAGAGAVLSYKQ